MNDRLWMQAVRRQQDEVRDEIMRHRLGAALAGRKRRPARWRKALGRMLVGLGELIEGEPQAPDRALPCN